MFFRCIKAVLICCGKKLTKGFTHADIERRELKSFAVRGFSKGAWIGAVKISVKCEYLSDNYLDSIVIACYICSPLRKRRIVLGK